MCEGENMFSVNLDNSRELIDDIDNAIIKLLGKRFNICRDIAGYKKANNIPMMQSKRVEYVINRCISSAEKEKIPKELIEKIYTLIIETSCELETVLME